MSEKRRFEAEYPGDEHPAYSRGEWKRAVALDETTAGYKEWVNTRLEDDRRFLEHLKEASAGSGRPWQA